MIRKHGLILGSEEASRRVEPSISVNTRVTVPPGSLLTAPSELSPQMMVRGQVPVGPSRRLARAGSLIHHIIELRDHFIGAGRSSTQVIARFGCPGNVLGGPEGMNP